MTEKKKGSREDLEGLVRTLGDALIELDALTHEEGDCQCRDNYECVSCRVSEALQAYAEFKQDNASLPPEP